MSSLGVNDPNRHIQIAAASLVPREEVATGKLGETCLREIVSVKTVRYREYRTSQR